MKSIDIVYKSLCNIEYKIVQQCFNLNYDGLRKSFYQSDLNNNDVFLIWKDNLKQALKHTFETTYNGYSLSDDIHSMISFEDMTTDLSRHCVDMFYTENYQGELNNGSITGTI